MSDSVEQQPQELEQPEAGAQEEQEPATDGDGDGAVAADPPPQQETQGDTEQKAAPEDGEGAKTEGGEEAVEKDVEDTEVTITHEDNQYWFSPEDCLAKGVAEEHISAFQHAYFQHSYTIKTWYESLSQHTFPTELIALSTDEVNVLLAASHPRQAETPELSDEQKETLEQIEKKLNDAIEKFEGDGAFIRINDRNPTDSILERNDAEFVAKIRDAVINELEVFKQSVDAYHLWQDQQKQEGAFRRGMSRIRQSFRRQRAPSALAASSTEKKEQTVKLEDTTGQEEKKEDEKKESEEERKEEEDKEKEEEPQPKQEEQKEEEGEKEGETVTVEAEVQEGGDKAEAAAEGDQEAPAEPEKQPGEGEAEETKTGDEKKDEDDIQKAPEEPEKAQPPKREEHPQIRKIKSESLDNEVLRAFGRVMTTMYKVASGKEALEMILRSGVTKQYFEQLRQFGEVEGLSATISVTRFHADIARYPGMVLRGFVYEGELTALSQKHDDITYFPNVAQYKNIVQYKVKQFHVEHAKEALAERGNYIIDVFVSADKVYILRLSPFYTGIGACLFTWAEDAKLLTRGPIDFKIVEAPRKAPDLYSGLQPHWNSMLDSVLQQKQNEAHSHGAGKLCNIL